MSLLVLRRHRTTLAAAAASLVAVLAGCGGRIAGAPSQADAGSADAGSAIEDSTAPLFDAFPAGFDASGPAANPDAGSDTGTAPLAADAGSLLNPTPCLIGGDVFYLGQIIDGARSDVATLQPSAAAFSVSGEATGPALSSLTVEAELPSGYSYSLEMTGTLGANGMDAPLEVGTYDGAGNGLVPGRGALMLAVDSDVCAAPLGRFTIESLVGTPDGELVTMTVAFATECTEPSWLYFGCVHVENLPVPTQ